MSQEVKFKVGKGHIENSDVGAPESCMVTNALYDALDIDRTRFVISTDYDAIVISTRKRTGFKQLQAVKTRIDEFLTEKIQDFDNSDPDLKPFEATINFPDNWREKLKEIEQKAAVSK